jgi:hypothetical protein
VEDLLAGAGLFNERRLRFSTPHPLMRRFVATKHYRANEILIAGCNYRNECCSHFNIWRSQTA